MGVTLPLLCGAVAVMKIGYWSSDGPSSAYFYCKHVTWKKISGCSLGLWGWRFLARVTVSWRGGWNTIELSVANKHLTDDFILFFFPTGITGATEQLAPPTRRLGLIKDLGRSTESLLVTRNRSSSHPPPLLDPPVPSVQLHWCSRVICPTSVCLIRRVPQKEGS